MVKDSECHIDRQRFQSILDAHRNRLGYPLVIPPAWAKKFKKMGITGPFIVSGKVPIKKVANPR